MTHPTRQPPDLPDETGVMPDPAETLPDVTAYQPVVADAVLEASLEERIRGRRVRVFARNTPALIGILFLVFVIVMAVFAPLVTTFDPNDAQLTERNLTPLTDGHLLGTDDLGRDIYSRLVYGARVSLLVGLGTVLAALAIALPIGMVAGYYEGHVDNWFMRVVDAILSIPPLLLVFAVAGTLGVGLRNAAIALGIFFAPVFIRLIRGEVRTVRRSQLVEAEVSVGAPTHYIMWRHILPVIAAPLIVQASLNVGTAILAETSLSFLGLGAVTPTASWGNMLRQAFDEIELRAWPVFIPGLAIAFTVLAINVFGDGLRDALGRVEQ